MVQQYRQHVITHYVKNVNPSVLQALLSVTALKKGKTTARETQPIGNERFDLAEKTAEILDGFAAKMGEPELAFRKVRLDGQIRFSFDYGKHGAAIRFAVGDIKT